MELKSRKTSYALIVVGLLDLYACGQSDFTSVERRAEKRKVNVGDVWFPPPPSLLELGF